MRYAFPAMALVVALFATTACGATAREKALKVSYASLTVAQRSFVEWDKYQQRQIVEKAQSLEAGKKALEVYREKRQPIVIGFSVAWSALAAASLYDEPGWIKAAVEATSRLYTLIKELQDGQGHD